MISLLLRSWDARHVAAYTVHEPADAPSDRIDRAEALIFVPDGFSYAAALFAPFWLASHRLWVALAVYGAATFTLAAALGALGIAPGWIAAALAAVNLWVGFEASEIQRHGLSLAGWSTVGSVSGRDLAECERRFFEHWLGQQPILARQEDDTALARLATAASPSLLGRLLAGRL